MLASGKFTDLLFTTKSMNGLRSVAIPTFPCSPYLCTCNLTHWHTNVHRSIKNHTIIVYVYTIVHLTELKLWRYVHSAFDVRRAEVCQKYFMDKMKYFDLHNYHILANSKRTIFDLHWRLTVRNAKRHRGDGQRKVHVQFLT